MSKTVLLLDWLCDWASVRDVDNVEFLKLYNAVIQAAYRGTLPTVARYGRRWVQPKDIAKWVAKYEGKKNVQKVD